MKRNVQKAPMNRRTLTLKTTRRTKTWYWTKMLNTENKDEKLSHLGPGRTRQFLCILRKNLSSFPWYKCARWIFFPPNFVKHYQTSQAPSSCFGAGQIFVRCENRTDFTICTAWSKEKVFKCAHDYQVENLAETNFVEVFGRAKQILSVQCVRTLSHRVKKKKKTQNSHLSWQCEHGKQHYSVMSDCRFIVGLLDFQKKEEMETNSTLGPDKSY
mgnify:CR=1 FL=1